MPTAVRESAPESHFLYALLRQGAPVIAGTPPELPAHPGWHPEPPVHRIPALARTDTAAPSDPLLVRATRYAMLLPLAYRLFVVPIIWSWLISGNDFAAVLPATLVTVLSTVTSLVGFAWVLRGSATPVATTRRLLWVDAAVAVLANLFVAATVPAALYGSATWVPWVYLSGTIALWTVARGVPGGLLLVLGSLPLQIPMLACSEIEHIGSPEVAGALAGSGLLLGSVVTAFGALVLVGMGTRLALAIGIRRGRIAERARNERALHDTVLQALEVMAMGTPDDRTDPATRLAEVRGAARAQANELRRTLSRSAENAPRESLGTELAALATEMARDGLRAQLVLADLDDDVLSEVRRIAVRDAVREALRNTIKHAGTGEVVVRLEEREGGIAVIARDHGIGYDERARPPGFGISNSMTARLAEVGGRCTVESRPGRGTRVTLWVPR